MTKNRCANCEEWQLAGQAAIRAAAGANASARHWRFFCGLVWALALVLGVLLGLR